MRICFIAIEIFAWGKYGGFGRATRTIGRELARRGAEVAAIVPRRGNQGFIEDLDGIRVYGYRQYDLPTLSSICRQVDADIYHSQEPSFGSFLARVLMPDRVHFVTCRDTRDREDWRIEWQLPTYSRLQVLKNRIFEDNPLVEWTVRNATRVYAASYYVQKKAQERYHLADPPEFLPTPVMVPTAHSRKADAPTVCFVARWDRRKRPALFFELAREFPEVRFIAVGSSHDKRWDRQLRSQYSDVPNLEMPGFLDQFAGESLSRLYEESWVLVNTAAREGLPNAFVEAAAHRCAILSSVDPDQFATRFGYYADRDDFAQGLAQLLQGDRWRELGQRAHDHARKHFSIDIAIQRHLAIYREALSPPRI